MEKRWSKPKLMKSKNMGEPESARVKQCFFFSFHFLFKPARPVFSLAPQTSRDETFRKSKPRFLLWTWRLREKFYVTYVYLPFYLSGGLGDSKIIGRDTKKMSQLHSWLHSRLQNQANSYWSLCYRASSHGWSASTFHSYCNNRGPTVTIIRAHGYIFGGYTDQSWRCKFVNCHRFRKITNKQKQTIKQINKKKSKQKTIDNQVFLNSYLKMTKSWKYLVCGMNVRSKPYFHLFYAVSY